LTEPPTDTERVAWHESGHVLAGAALGLTIVSVTLWPGVTRVLTAPEDPRLDLLWRTSGHAAERLAFGSVPELSRPDAARAEAAAYRLTGASDVPILVATVAEAEAEVATMLQARWRAVERVALQLLAYGELVAP
jgi:hypothetical protein